MAMYIAVIIASYNGRNAFSEFYGVKASSKAVALKKVHAHTEEYGHEKLDIVINVECVTKRKLAAIRQYVQDAEEKINRRLNSLDYTWAENETLFNEQCLAQELDNALYDAENGIN